MDLQTFVDDLLGCPLLERSSNNSGEELLDQSFLVVRSFELWRIIRYTLRMFPEVEVQILLGSIMLMRDDAVSQLMLMPVFLLILEAVLYWK